MSFEPKDFYDFSCTLLENSNREVDYRVVISRTYYAAFGVAKNFIGNTFVMKGDSGHQDLIKKLGAHFDTEIQKASKTLEYLLKKRKEADYDYRKTIGSFDADYCVKDAVKFFKAIDDYTTRQNQDDSNDDDLDPMPDISFNQP